MTARVVPALAAGLMSVLLLCGASRQQRPAPQQPDPEFIEFLGSSVTAGGKTVDPLVFADEEKSAQHGGEKRRQPREQQQNKPAAKTRQETERTEQ